MVLSALPAWFRFLQCLRRYYDLKNKDHIINAGKYLCIMAVTLFAGLHRIYGGAVLLGLYIAIATLGVIYTSGWDIIMDWGLLKKNSKHRFLRDSLMFPEWVYYVAIPINVAFRCAWVFTISESAGSPQLVTFFLALAEVYRRCQWNIFRLENEHLNNADEYRAVKKIPMPYNLDHRKEFGFVYLKKLHRLEKKVKDFFKCKIV